MDLYGVELIEKDDMVCLHQKNTGRPFEYESIIKWLDQCGHGSTVVDIGSYSGLYAIAAAKAGADVIAFEPNQKVFRRLIENMDANNVNFEVYNCAVGADIGTVSMTLNQAVELTSGGKVTPGGPIQQTAIDRLGIDAVRAIKIDVEGFECEVLKGAIKTLTKHKPVIISEALTDNDLIAQAKILEPIGYSYSRADERNVIWSQ